MNKLVRFFNIIITIVILPIVLFACTSKTSTDAGVSNVSGYMADSSNSVKQGSILEVRSTATHAETGPALVELDMFQVVAIPLLDRGRGVLTTEREAPLVADRAAVVRAKIGVPTGWAAQAVEFRIAITIGSETTELGTNTLVRSTTKLEDPSAGLFIEVPASLIQPQATYSVSLWVGSEQSARYPETGQINLAPQVTGPIHVHIVPYKIAGLIPDVSKEAIDGYKDAIFAYYPTTNVEITVGALQENSAPEADLRGALGEVVYDVGQLMESSAEQAPRRTYYYALMSIEGHRDDFEGRTGSSQELDRRAGFAAGAAFVDDEALNQSTLVHELGHLHFLLHAPCGSAENVDPLFPYDDGMAHTEGFDVRTGTFIAEDAGSDLMGYCASSRWVSSYQYAKIARWIQSTQSW